MAPAQIISHAVWLYASVLFELQEIPNFSLSGASRITSLFGSGVRFGPAPDPPGAGETPGRRGTWTNYEHPRSPAVSLAGCGPDGDMIDILAPRRYRHAAERFFRKILKGKGRRPASDPTAAQLLSPRPRDAFCRAQHAPYENNRAEISHQPTRQRERQIRRFKSTAHA